MNAYDEYYSNVILLLPLEGANNGTTFTDYSTPAKTFTRTGNVATKTAVSKWENGSGYFEGSGDYLTASVGMPATSDYTVECWAYPTANKSYSTILGFYVSGTGRYYFSINSGRISYWRGPSDSLNGDIVELNTWTHLAWSKSGSSILLFKNGVLSNTGVANSLVTNNFRIGQYSSSAECFQGYLQDLRVTTGLARYTENFTPPDGPLPRRATLYKVSGIAKFTDDAIATSVKAWRADTGALGNSATPDPVTGAFELLSLPNTAHDVSIFRNGYRPLTHGPITPVPY